MEAVQICGDSKKRHRESPPPVRSLFEIFGKEFDAVNAHGIIKDINNLLRTQDSCKESWDCGWMPEISYKELELEYWDDYSESQLKEAQVYMNSTADGKFFDVPPPKKRPDCLSEGFFVVCSEKQDSYHMFHDPVFETRFKFHKFAAFTEKLGMAAVEYHNWITGSDLWFSRIKKANLYTRFCDQCYFITLEAKDDKSGRVITCQSMVRCAFQHSNWIALKKFDDNPDDVYVHSFCWVK